MPSFDDSRLDDPGVLAQFDLQLRHLASAGARIRIEAQDLTKPDPGIERPRGIVIVGQESRLIRAVLERICPVPLVAWAFSGLPGWVGALDLVIVLASDDNSEQLLSNLNEAARRGASLLVVCPQDSALAGYVPSTAYRVNTTTTDPTAGAVACLELLSAMGIGSNISSQTVAEAADMVAEESSPHKDISTNPAKGLAIGLADHQPLIWGGSVLAARASRRIAEAIRRSSGIMALAADAKDIYPMLQHCQIGDPFADPVEATDLSRPVLVLLEDESEDNSASQDRKRLTALADAKRVRIIEISTLVGTPVDRYVSLKQKGLYAATYLALGMSADSRTFS